MLKKFLNFISLIIVLIGILLGVYLIYNRQYSPHAKYYQYCVAGGEALKASDKSSAYELFSSATSIDPSKGTAWLGLLQSTDDKALFGELVIDLLSQSNLTDAEYVEVLDFLVKNDTTHVARVLAHYQLDYPLSMSLLRFRGIHAVQSGEFSTAVHLLEHYLSVVNTDNEIKSILLRIYLASSNRIDLVRAKVLLFELLDAGKKYDLYAFVRLLTESDKIVLLDAEITEIGSKIDDLAFYERLCSTVDIQFLRTLYNYFKVHRIENYIRIGETLADHKDANAADRYECISSFLLRGDVDSASERLKEFSDIGGDDREVILALEAFYSLQVSEFDNAYDSFKALEHDFPQSKIGLSVLKMALFSKYQLPAGIEQDYVDLLLKYDGVLSSQEIQQLYSRMLAMSPLDKLNLMEQIQSKDNIDDVSYSTWLFNNSFYRELVEFYSTGELSSKITVFPYYFDSLLKIGNYDRAKLSLEENQGKLTQSTYYFLRSRYYFALENVIRAGEDWDVVFSLSKDVIAVRDISRLARLAVQWGDLDRAYEAYSYLEETNILLSPDDLLIYGSVFVDRRGVEDALELYSWADDMWVDNRISSEKFYLEMLIDRDAYESEARLEKLFEDNPDVKEFRVHLALAYLLGHKEGEALRLLDTSDFNWEEEGQKFLWIYASVLTENHGLGVAQPIINLVNKDELSSEEVRLMNQFVKL